MTPNIHKSRIIVPTDVTDRISDVLQDLRKREGQLLVDIDKYVVLPREAFVEMMRALATASPAEVEKLTEAVLNKMDQLMVLEKLGKS